jgi:protein-glutamine gamma-glutamyltransferase
VRRLVGVVLAAATAALTFAPVFGFVALLPLVGAPALAVLAVLLAATRWAGLRDWRPLVAALAGLLAVIETLLGRTTVAGVPTVGTFRALGSGVAGSLRLTLESTWPARADAAEVVFVPLLVVVAAVLGGELVQRPALRPVALLPSLMLLVLAQSFSALPPAAALLGVAAYAVCAGAVLAGELRWRRTVPVIGLVVGAVALTALVGPVGPARYSLHTDRSAPVADGPAVNPLDEIAYRLATPGTEVFRVRAPATADRWTLAVFAGFDGVTWSDTDRYRRLGTELPPDPGLTVPVHRDSAEVHVTGLDGPWLPSQTAPATVTGGPPPLVAPRDGTLLQLTGAAAAQYTLTWWQPTTNPDALADAAIDPAAADGPGGLGPVPDAVTRLAGEAVHGLRPSMRAALVLEDYLRQNYRLAVGQPLPSGHAWPQLTDFLLGRRRGTSEQFAAAYVALARLRGIPARLAVGFRSPARRDPDGWTTVHNGDVLAWPEVAVAGLGWVPLDPSGAATPSPADSTGPAAAAERARSRLPAPSALRDAPVARARPSSVIGHRVTVSWPWLLGPVAVLAAWLVGVPAAWAVRAWRRRRRAGPAAVVGAWHEVRDRLRAHGVAVAPGETVRDLGDAAARIADPATVAAVADLAGVVDRALWSNRRIDLPVRDSAVAWASVREVRRGLARRGTRARMRAAWNLGALRPPVSGRRSRRGSASVR